MNILTTFYQHLTVTFTNLVFAQSGGPGTSGGPPPPDTTSAVQTITTSPIWTNVVVPVSVALGVATLIYGTWKVITGVFKADVKVGGTIVKTLILAAFLFRLDLVFVIIEVTARAIGGLIESINSLIT